MYKVNYYRLKCSREAVSSFYATKEEGLAALREAMDSEPDNWLTLDKETIETSTPKEAILLAAAGRCTTIECVAEYRPYWTNYGDEDKSYPVQYFRRWDAGEPGRVRILKDDEVEA